MEKTGTRREEVVGRVFEIAERVGAPEGIEIVDVDLRGGGKSRLLRIYVDKPDGVSHGDCEFISKNVGTILDVEDVIPGGTYRLEVSSPGVERPLKRARDYERYIGRKAKVLLREPVADKRRWEGVLAGLSGSTVTLAPASGESVQFDVHDVERANLKFEW
jgi:ribosome maturation factor RimP